MLLQLSLICFVKLLTQYKMTSLSLIRRFIVWSESDVKVSDYPVMVGGEFGEEEEG